MGRVVIACYRPKPGMKPRLIELTRTHVSRLRAEDLVTDRQPIAMEALDGTIVEVFEWKSKQAIESAHSNPRVQEMWRQYEEVAEFVPLAEVAEAKALFSEFTPLDVP